MKYKEYFTQTEFEDVWNTLHTYYQEPASLKKAYKTLFYTIRNLPIDEEHSESPLIMKYGIDNMVHVEGAPDPIEWLTGREVEFGKKYHYHNLMLDTTKLPKPSILEMAAHLLYWSTLYDFKTKARYIKDYQQYIDSLENGPAKFYYEDNGQELSLLRKRRYYWKDVVDSDSMYDWSSILDILRMRIEYHMGYHRYTDRFVNTKHYVQRMELATKLLSIASSDYFYGSSCKLNYRNASRFVGKIFTKWDLERINTEDGDQKYQLADLRRAKAYKILWKFLDHNLCNWRD